MRVLYTRVLNAFAWSSCVASSMHQREQLALVLANARSLLRDVFALQAPIYRDISAFLRTCYWRLSHEFWWSRAGVSCPNGCMLQYVWWIAHLCMPKPCTQGDAICNTYVDGGIPFGNGVDNLNDVRDSKGVCDAGLNPAK